MAQILAFAGSNSSTSINFKMVKYTAGLIDGHSIQLLNMANYPFPMYSTDLEREKGFSNSLVELKDDIRNSDGIIISVNEHNGGPSAYYKNLMDWLSRLERKFMQNKKVMLMSCSPGKRGAIGSLEFSQKLLSGFGAEIISSFSFPNFKENFEDKDGITNADLAEQHTEALENFLSKL